MVYSTAESRAGVKVQYSVSHSQTYQVPVLHFQIEGLGEMNRLQFIYDHLVPSTRSKELHSVGVTGAISQTVCRYALIHPLLPTAWLTIENHPANNIPCFFVHPCRTSEAMASLTLDRDISTSEYLQIWIGLIGSVVGLNLPIELAIR